MSILAKRRSRPDEAVDTISSSHGSSSGGRSGPVLPPSPLQANTDIFEYLHLKQLPTVVCPNEPNTLGDNSRSLLKMERWGTAELRCDVSPRPLTYRLDASSTIAIDGSCESFQAIQNYIAVAIPIRSTQDGIHCPEPTATAPPVCPSKRRVRGRSPASAAGHCIRR